MTQVEAAIDEALVSLTGSTAQVRRDEHSYNCPFCGKENHLYVNYTKGVYNCFACGDVNEEARGSLKKLARFLGVEWEEETDEYQVEEAPGEVRIRDDESAVPLPADFQLLSPDNTGQVQQFCYLHARGLSWEDILSYRIGVAFGGDRVVFPDFNRYGQVRWWLGRAISDRAKPKYKGPPGERWGKIGNYHRALAASSDWMGVCEGPMDGIVAGPEFAWLLGKGHTREQTEVLASSGRRIVVALDGDLRALSSAQSLVEDLRILGTDCLFCGVPAGEDPASVGRVKFRQLLTGVLAEGPYFNELNYYQLATETYS